MLTFQLRRILLIAILVFATSISILTIQDSFAEGQRKKILFTGDQQFFLDRERPSLSYFYSDPYNPLPYSVNATMSVGGKEIEMRGDGFTQPTGYRYDKTCKKVYGFEVLDSEQGDHIRIDYNGLVCIISPQKKVISVTFTGTEQAGVFEGYVVSGTITGTSDFYERTYDLHIKSVMVTPRG